MSKIEKFEDIIAWQKARELTRFIYKFTNEPNFAKDFGLKDQIRRSAVSVASNIAEGYGRGGTKEFYQFLAIAKGSLFELKTQLYIALDLNYIFEEEFKNTTALIDDVGKLISGLMNYIQKSDLKGGKYKTLN